MGTRSNDLFSCVTALRTKSREAAQPSLVTIELPKWAVSALS